MNNITVFTVVYNEEARIETLLKNCLWSDDIIIYDKSSTDLTRELATKYPCRIIKIPYYDTGSGPTKNIVKDAKNNWILAVSCSDIMHPKLVDNWFELINESSFKYDVIAFPYQVGVFGIFSKKSPWSSFPLKTYLFKKNAVIFTEKVHKEILLKPCAKIYKMKKSEKYAVFHLTHENLDIFFERHIRYCKAETNRDKYNKYGLFKVLCEIIAAILWMVFYKRVLFRKHGFALFIAFLSYFFMKYLFVWEKKYKLGSLEYANIRNEILDEWEKKHNKLYVK